MITPETVARLAALESNQDFASLIAELRQRLAVDRSGTLCDSWVKGWISRRYRSLFLDACEVDRQALAAVPRDDDGGDWRRRLAERFLVDASDDVLATRQPPAAGFEIQNTTLIFCPGLLNGLLPVTAFGTAFPYVEETYGMRVLAADAHPLRACDENVADLLATLEQGLGFDARSQPLAPEAAIPPGDVVLVGYSKGLPDALHLLRQRPDMARRVRAVVSWAGAFGGSYLADEILDSIRDHHLGPEDQEALIRLVAKPVMPGVVLQNMDRRKSEYNARAALEQLRTEYRDRFAAEMRAELEAFDLPWLYVLGSAKRRDVPYFHLPLSLEVSRHDRDNDMQLTRGQATIPLPAAVCLAQLHADHWDIAYDSFPQAMRFGSKNLAHPFPCQAGLAALVALMAELGFID